MNKEELAAYYRYIDNLVILRDNIYTARAEGRAEGLEEVRAEREKHKAIEVARFLQSSGSSVELIAGATGLSREEIESL